MYVKEEMGMKLVKICGITQEKEADVLNEMLVDYVGFIQFVDWSKRNIPLEDAVRIMRQLDDRIHTVAVTVNPDAEQLDKIQNAGFSHIQIHGTISEKLLDRITLPVIKAFNGKDVSGYERYRKNDKIIGYIFDAHTPGSGEAFDWESIKNMPRDNKMRLVAGGIHPDNAALAVEVTGFDGVDVSSGVENDNGIGKSSEKIRKLVNKIRAIE